MPSYLNQSPITKNRKRACASPLLVPIISLFLINLWPAHLRAAQVVLCGKSITYDNNGIQAGSQSQRNFIGVWSGGTWNVNICGALIVEGVGTDGTATVKYIYGPTRPNSKI